MKAKEKISVVVKHGKWSVKAVFLPVDSDGNGKINFYTKSPRNPRWVSSSWGRYWLHSDDNRIEIIEAPQHYHEILDLIEDKANVLRSAS